MAKKVETGITDDIVEHIKERGGDAYKTLGTATQRGGEPDVTGEIYSERIGLWLHLKLEVKTDEGEATGRQEFHIELYQKRGYVAGIVRSVADVDLLITDYEDAWLASNAEHLAWKEQLQKQAEDNVRQVFGPELVQERDSLLEVANGLQAQISTHDVYDNELRTEIAQLRAWVDRFYRVTQWVDVEGLKREVKKALDWL